VGSHFGPAKVVKERCRFDAAFDTSCHGNEPLCCKIVAGRAAVSGFGKPDAVWRRPRCFVQTMKRAASPLRSLDTALSSQALSHAFCHIGLARRPGRHRPGRASLSLAKAVGTRAIPLLTPTSTCPVALACRERGSSLPLPQLDVESTHAAATS
jgi:hypothetical protein